MPVIEVEVTATGTVDKDDQTINNSLEAIAKEIEKQINPEENASCCSKLCFSWISGTLKRGSTRPLVPKDIPQPLSNDASTVCHDRFDEFWQQEDLDSLRNTPPHKRGVKSICCTSLRFVGAPALRSSLYYLIYVVLTFVPPYLLKAIVGHLEGSVSYSQEVLWVLVIGTLVVPPLNSLVLSQHNAIMVRAGVQLRTALSTQIFRKGMRLSNAARQTKDTGQIVNILSNDAVKPVMFFGLANSIWANPIIVVVSLYLIGQEVGEAMWFAMLTLFSSKMFFFLFLLSLFHLFFLTFLHNLTLLSLLNFFFNSYACAWLCLYLLGYLKKGYLKAE